MSSTVTQTALIVIKKLRVAVARVRFVQFVSSAVVSVLSSLCSIFSLTFAEPGHSHNCISWHRIRPRILHCWSQRFNFFRVSIGSALVGSRVCRCYCSVSSLISHAATTICSGCFHTCSAKFSALKTIHCKSALPKAQNRVYTNSRAATAEATSHITAAARVALESAKFFLACDAACEV
jgi:hypothetical protein